MTKRIGLVLWGWMALGLAAQRNVSAQEALGTIRSNMPPSATFTQIDISPAPSSREPDETTAESERVIVTGSYIPVAPTAAEVGPNPVLVIDRYTIDKAGERTAVEVLRNLPLANANGVATSGNAGSLEQGTSSASLRGFDAGATLTLIDGRRMVTQPSGVHGGFEFVVDLNTIPKAVIERVEILKDGASSTYGADAVAGVINIKLRNDYRGAELTVDYGNTTDRDSGSLATSLVFGVGNDRTNLTGVLNYYRRNSIFSRDRAYDADVPPSRVSLNSSPYNLQVDRAAAEAAAGRPITEVPLFDANGNRIDSLYAHSPLFTLGTAAASDYVYTEGPALTFPANRYAGELPDTERYGAYLSASHKLFGDRMVAYADVFFQRAAIDHEQAPAGTFPFRRSGVQAIAIPPHAPGATLGGPTYEETGLSSGAYNPFNPFQQIISGDSMGRLFDFGNRMFDSRTDAFFTTAGVRGDKLFDGNWGYDGAIRYSRVDSTLTFRGPSTARFDRVLNAADPIFDPGSSQYIGTTVPYNPFGDYRVPIATNRKLIDYVIAETAECDLGTLATFDFNIYTTALFRLPAGGIGVAVGAQFQHETNDQNPRALLLNGDLVGDFQYYPVHGKRDTYAAYAEASIPVFGANFTAPGLHALDFTAAGRYEEFLNNGTNVMVPKLGLRWQPLDDSLTFRATWGEGYKQPTLVQLFAPVLSGQIDVFDPVNAAFVPAVTATLVPNPNLQPEDSRNVSAGIVYSPKFVPGLTVTLDMFGIETTGWVTIPNPSDVIARVGAGHPLPLEAVTRDANGNLTSFTATFVNTGTQKARGADLGVAYQIQTSFGTFTSTTQTTFLDSFQFSPTPVEAERELRSRPLDNFSDDAYLKWKASSRVDWTWRGFGAAVTANYRDGFHELTAAGNEHWVRQTCLFDLQVSYEFGVAAEGESEQKVNRANGSGPRKPPLDGTSIRIGCTNVFDHDPPRANDNFPRFLYDPTGRFVYLSVTKRF